MTTDGRSPKIEALLPAWKAAAFIQATLDSLSAQTHDDFAVCVSVDRCDDETEAICRRHAQDDPRFRVIRQDNRLGYAGNCNFLLDQSNAEYALFAFHDDTLAPTYLAKLSEALDVHPEAVMSYSDVELTHVNGDQEHWAYTALDGVTSRVERGIRMLMGAGPWWTPNRGMFRLAPARTIGGIKTHGAGEFAVDWPWLFRISLLGEFVRVPETLCFKVYKPGSLSRTWAYSQEQFFEVDVAHLREIWNADVTGDEKFDLAVALTNRLIEHVIQPKRASPPQPR